MQKYRAVIIDDEDDSRSNTRNMLEKYCPEIEIVGEADNAPDGKLKIQELKPHVVFLDINMPGMNGFQMLEGIYERDFCVVFITAYGEHGITAVKAGATDYLLKPLMLSELQAAIRKVAQYYEGKNNNSAPKTEQDKNTIMLYHHKGFTIIDISEIVWIEANDNYSNIYLSDGRKILMSKSLKDIESFLPETEFFRIHRSASISVNHVKEYNNDKNEILLSDGSHIPASRTRIAEFGEFLRKRNLSTK